MKNFFCVIILAVLTGKEAAEEEAIQLDKLHPIVLVPGDGGSNIEARLNKTSTVSYFCHKTSDWYTLWLDAEQLISWASSCWIDNIKLRYNQTDRTTFNNDGVETRIPGFGNTSSVEYLNPFRSSYATYFSKIVEELVPLGYERGGNIHGAPYDFRKAANEQADYFNSVTQLIESTFEKNGGSKVILLCHSMGSPMMLHLLQSKTDEWKEKYIRALVTLAGVWGGTVRALKVYLLGDNLGSRIVDSGSIGDQERTNPSLAWLMPKDIMWGPDEVVLQSDNVNITVQNYAEIFNILNHTDGRMMWEDTRHLLQDLKAPNVETYCIHGDGVPSVEKIVYKDFPKSTPNLETGDGDGTVNIRSLLGCLRWRDQQKQSVYHYVFKGIDHGEILKNPESAEYVKRLIINITRNVKEESLDKEVNFVSNSNWFKVSGKHQDRLPSPLNVERFDDDDDNVVTPNDDNDVTPNDDNDVTSNGNEINVKIVEKIVVKYVDSSGGNVKTVYEEFLQFFGVKKNVILNDNAYDVPKDVYEPVIEVLG